MSQDDAVREILDELWDADRRLYLLARGAMSGRDLSAMNLHPIRDSALGAVMDFDRSNDQRANTALREVLSHQYNAPDRPWHGTFKVVAEERIPKWPGAEQWRHYDPNWRQFLGCILAFITLRYPDHLDEDVRTGIDAALVRCVKGEPKDRIPDWYTNPNLLHAWLTAHVGQQRGDATLLAAGERRRAMLMERLRAFGDVDEYNSPTYDGVDIWAALLWIVYPPSEAFRIDGEVLAATLLTRIETLYHHDLKVTCGPYSRVYGLWLDEYVSLTGLVVGALGVQGSVVPTELNVDTDHVHDLYFWPMLRELMSAAPQLSFSPQEVARSHVQVFGAAIATSVIGARYCVGFENGRQVSFARDQYVPVVVHYMKSDGIKDVVALMLGEAEVELHSHLVAPTQLAVTVSSVQPGSNVGLRLISSPQLSGITIDMDHVPVTAVTAQTQASLIGTTLTFDVAQVQMQITWPDQ